MVVTCSRNGLLAAWRRPRLVLVLWVWNLLFATVIAFPAWRWWYGSTAWSPEADGLLRRFSFGVITELLRNDSPLTLLIMAFVALAVLAFIGQALVAGGTIEVLTTDDARPLLHRFFRGAGHFFWRFLRASVVAALTILIGAMVVVFAFRPLARALEEIDWEPMWYLGQVTSLLIIALVALVVILALDYARIRMVREDSRRSLRAFVGGLAFVGRHAGATFGVWLVVAVLTAAAFAVYLAYGEIAPAVSWATILPMLAVQQATILVRAGLRVALVGAEIDVREKLGDCSRFEVRSSRLAGGNEFRTSESAGLEIPHQATDKPGGLDA